MYKITLEFTYKSRYGGRADKSITFNNYDHYKNWKRKWWDKYQMDNIKLIRHNNTTKP